MRHVQIVRVVDPYHCRICRTSSVYPQQTMGKKINKNFEMPGDKCINTVERFHKTSLQVTEKNINRKNERNAPYGF